MQFTSCVPWPLPWWPSKSSLWGMSIWMHVFLHFLVLVKPPPLLPGGWGKGCDAWHSVFFCWCCHCQEPNTAFVKIINLPLIFLLPVLVTQTISWRFLVCLSEKSVPLQLPSSATDPVLSLPLRRVRFNTIHVSVSPTLLSPEPLKGVISVKRSSHEHLQPLLVWHSYHWEDSRCAHVVMLNCSCCHEATVVLPCLDTFYFICSTSITQTGSVVIWPSSVSIS